MMVRAQAIPDSTIAPHLELLLPPDRLASTSYLGLPKDFEMSEPWFVKLYTLRRSRPFLSISRHSTP